GRSELQFLASVTATLKLNEPVAVGVPERFPFGSRVKPGGGAPLTMKLCGDAPSDVEDLMLQGWAITHAGRAGAAGASVYIPQRGPPEASARPAKRPAAPAAAPANTALRAL